VREVAGGVLAEHGACRVLTNLGTYQDSKHCIPRHDGEPIPERVAELSQRSLKRP
jgi:hypothetical protein